MLLFACGTADDTVTVYDTVSLEFLGEVEYSLCHESPIGPRAGARVGNKTIIAGCYNNMLSIVNNEDFKEAERISVGAYPISVIADEDSAYIACGDSNSIWTLDKNLEVAYIDITVQFPYCMAAGKKELCVCGFTQGDICIYDKNDFAVKKRFFIEGYPSGTAYFADKSIVAYNNENAGRICFDGMDMRIGSRVGKITVYDERIYACVDDISVAVMDGSLHIENSIFVKEPISDFAVCDEGIFVSELLGNSIKKFSHKGKELGRINLDYSGCSLILS